MKKLISKGIGAYRRRRSGGLIVDNFAGGGGASHGIELATGYSPNYAINHNDMALEMHEANHPDTVHIVEDVWKVDPTELCDGRDVDLAWFSPDCKHFSKAKGGRPVSPRIRGLAWVVIRWAKAVKPKVIILENVEEFKTWGPLLVDGTPCPKRKGETFISWLDKLKRYGYEAEVRELRACDYGAPTIRKRLFVIARCDGKPIVWPEPTHGPGKLPYKTAADCIDWSVPCPSIFERKRELAEKTQKRIARGIFKFVLDNPRPFIVPLTHTGDKRVYDIDEPMRTIAGANRDEQALVSPTLIQTGYGERKGQAPRTLDLHKPLGTIVTGGGKHALVAAFLAKHYGERKGGFAGGASLKVPAPTMTATNNKSLVVSHLSKFYKTSTGQSVDEPMPTVTAGGQHVAEVRAFLIKYFGTATGQTADSPIGTITTKARYGIITVNSEDYIISDIGMRMLTPRELFRAQGFADDYVIDPIVDGKRMTKTNQIRMCGNSVCPPIARALVDANVKLSGRRKKNASKNR